MTRPFESVMTLYGRTRNLKLGAPATTSTSLFQKPIFWAAIVAVVFVLLQIVFF